MTWLYVANNLIYVEAMNLEREMYETSALFLLNYIVRCDSFGHILIFINLKIKHKQYMIIGWV